METTLPVDWFSATDALTNYSFVLPFERHWNRTSATIWMQRNWTLSIWSSFAYMILIFGVQKLMQTRRAFELRWPLAVWNGLLASFSLVGFVRSSPEFVRVLFGQSFYHSVCVPSYAQDSVCGFWMEAFILSKVCELLDTVFIVVRKRPLIFLHWYHHVTVLVYCWHAMKDHTAAGRWFSLMNYAVHSVMYAYYAASAMRLRAPRWVSMTITSMQLSQMIVGCYLVYYVYWTKTNQPERMCHQTWENLYFCFAIYTTYFLLFLNFFYKAYVESALKRKSKKAAAEAKAKAAMAIANGSTTPIDDAIHHDSSTCTKTTKKGSDGEEETNTDNGHVTNGNVKNGLRARNGFTQSNGNHHHHDHHHENGNAVANGSAKKRD